jgi:hypothetical protein
VPTAAVAAVAQRLQTLRPALGKRGAMSLALYCSDNNAARAIDLAALHAQLAQRFGRARGPPGATGESIQGTLGGGGGASVERVRLKMGSSGAKKLARSLRLMDSDGDALLTKEELKHGLEVSMAQQ